MDSIKITALTPIGGNIAYTTLVPVVNMAGTPLTQRATVQVLGNLILNSAGGSYFPAAAQAILAQSVTNAAQPNITSVGTLTSLTVNDSIDGGNINADRLIITGTSNLGIVGNVTIAGGSNGYVLQTNGNGELSWTSQSGGGGGGNSISDGTSNVSVASTDGNVVIGVNNDAMNWTFATDGNVYPKPENDFVLLVADINEDDLVIEHIITDGNVELSRTSLASGQFSIYTNLDSTGEEWRFEGNTLQVTNDSLIRGFDSNVTVQSMFAGTSGTASLQSVSNQNDPNIFTTIDATTSGANIKVYNGGSNSGIEYAWLFDNTGNFSLPDGPSIYSQPAPDTGSTIVLQPAGAGVSTDQKLMIYPTAGDGDHLHLVTGNLYQTELFLGDDNFYMKLANTGNIVLNANDSTGNIAQLILGSDSNLVLPAISLGVNINEETVIRSQRKIIPPFRQSAIISGSTPTVVYTVSSSAIITFKATLTIQHQGLGYEMFDVSGMADGANTIQSVSNRMNGTGQTDTSVLVDYNGTSQLQITLTINSGATTSWVNYDATEFGIPQD